MKIEYKLDAFEGPQDLLLHLIEKNKINIYDIPIVEITDQYMEYLEKMRKQYPIDSLSEFIVMASTLLRIKSKMLLPSAAPDEEEEDPREELVKRLTEYKMYKYAAQELKDMSLDAEKVYFRQETIPKGLKKEKPNIKPEDIIGDLTLTRLSEVFQEVMRRKRDREDPVRSKFGKIRKERYKVEDCMEEIRNKVRGFRRFHFRTLLEIQPTKEKVVVHFLAVLELIKIGSVSVSQEDNFSEIYITSLE